MKTTPLLFLISMAASAAQAPGNVIACDPANAGQCKATIIEGRPVRELVHDGTRVAVGKPMATVDGDYRVFVRITQVGPGKTEIRPKHFSGLSSDPAHTRFAFYDKATEINQRIREANQQQAEEGDALDIPNRGSHSPVMSPAKAAKLGLKKVDPDEVASRQSDAGASRGTAQKPGTTIRPEELYLSSGRLRTGDFSEGLVYFKKPRRSKVAAGVSDSLHEIDIPLNGVVFQFNLDN
jgi:hypothetical protein